jgi:uncharacterized membrane protein YedE/YeeE
MALMKVLSTAILAALAVLVGLFMAMVVAVGSIFVFLARRIFGGTTRRPSTAPEPAMETAPRAPRSMSESADVIEVTATEVPADPSVR